MNVLGWKVYCGDGSIWTDHPEQIPPDVQVIILYHEYPYRTTEHGVDYYELEGVTLVGKEMPYEDYLKILDAAMNDMDWPQ